ncbi:MAG: CDP-alcohol phosphatidyltransferase family protein [Planctomycetota bacterium]
MTTPQPTSKVKTWRLLNWPNRISILRLLLVAPFVLLLLYQRALPSWSRYVALGIFLAVAVSDFLDGMLARRLNSQTRLGAILDPLADKVLIVCAVVILAQDQFAIDGVRLPRWLVVAVVGKDLWVVVGFIVMFLATDRFRNRPDLTGKACTFGQVLLVGFTLLAPDLNLLLPKLGNRIVLGLAGVVTGLCVLAGISYTRYGLRYIVTEGKSLDDPRAGAPENPLREHD